MLAVMALALAIVLALNVAVSADGNRDMFSWAIGLAAVAVLFWIWMRRDAMAEQDADSVGAAEDAAREAEDLARRTLVRREGDRDSAEPDDLTKLNGIGAVFQTVLNDAGISTYAQLAVASIERLEAIFDEADRSRPNRLETWSTQAEFAANDDWDGLRKYLDSD